ncbi:MAG: nickel-dependent putative hexonate epimerase [Planctomycetota bacterium]|jgi:nickel-dependent lactate racemase
MTILFADGKEDRIISDEERNKHLDDMIEKIGGDPQKILLLPPDHTRLYSEAGPITDYLYQKFTAAGKSVEIMPALGTHVAMNEKQLRMMFGENIPLDAFIPHDWRNDVIDRGTVSSEKIKEFSDGQVDYDMKVMVNKRLFEGNYDLILSIGQVVPHEVVGMANYTKNICVGCGGPDMINKSHFLGAACNMEKILGQIDNPVRKTFNYAYDEFISELPVYFILTVIGKENDDLVMRGIYGCDDNDGFVEAAKLSQQVNLDLLDKPMKKAVVYLTPKEFNSTWLGNKAVYRTRMAIADDGELIILAPAVHEFGEDKEIDQLIRKYGYNGTPATMKAVDENEELKNNLSAAAHLIHGSSEGRFTITYCTDPEKLSKEEVEGVGFKWAPYSEVAEKYNPDTLKDGWQEVDGEEIYYVSNPALGLWALKENF